jgi:hypothetical protein
MTRGPGHYHPELWNVDQQHRYEDRIGRELKDLEQAVDKLTQRVTYLLGAIGVLVFVLPIAAPFIRSFLGMP